MYPEPIQKLINKLAKLPSIGPKTAERLVFYLLKRPPAELDELQAAIAGLKNSIIPCRQCHSFGETDPCPICADQRRNRRFLCLVGKPQDIAVLEKTHAFNGLYFVFGSVNPFFDQNAAPQLTELTERIKQDEITEIILGFNADMEGESTVLFLSKLFKQIPGLSLSRLARGLPMGADVEYADEITLENAIKGRQILR